MNALETPETQPFLEAIHSTLPVLETHREASETARSAAPESIAALKQAGLSRLLSPALYGGHEAPIRAQLLACSETARACPATSWVMMVCGAHNWVAGSYSPQCREEIFGPDPELFVAGTLAAQGQFKKADGGWRLSGRWQFCSGVDHAPWLLVSAARPKDSSDGPNSVHAFIPRDQAQIDDTWFTLGMRGSGSKDIVLEDVFVPAHRVEPTGRLFNGASPHALDHASGLYVLPVASCLATQVGGCLLGMAREMLRLFIEKTRVRPDIYTGQGKGAKARSAGIQRRVAEASGEITTAELLLGRSCDILDAISASKTPTDLATQSRLRWQATYAAELCRRAVDRLFVGAGAHAAFDGEPLQRYYRDVMMATRHAMVDLDGTAEMEGKTLLGVEP